MFSFAEALREQPASVPAAVLDHVTSRLIARGSGPSLAAPTAAQIRLILRRGNYQMHYRQIPLIIAHVSERLGIARPPPLGDSLVASLMEQWEMAQRDGLYCHASAL